MGNPNRPATTVQTPVLRTEIESYIRTIATLHGLDPERGVRQCATESSFNPAAVSRCGAIGLFQLMPATAKELGVDPHDWKQNVAGWADYMAELLRLFGNNYDQALAAYNAGMGTVRRLLIEHGEGWKAFLPKETQDYIKKIL